MQIRRRYSRSRLTLMDAVVGTILTLMALLVILPFYNAIMISFVTESEYFRNPFILFPHEPTLEAYATLLDTGNILAGYGNTLIHIQWTSGTNGGIPCCISTAWKCIPCN